MPKREFLMGTVVVLVLVGMAGYLYSDRVTLPDWLRWPWGNEEAFGPDGEPEIQTEEGSDQLVSRQRRDVEDIAQEFTDLYVEAVKNNNEETALKAKDLLTERGRLVVEKGENPPQGLLRFTRDLEVPQKVTITNVTKASDTFAEASSQWIFATGTVERFYYFRFENGEWKIDSIQQVEQ